MASYKTLSKWKMPYKTVECQHIMAYLHTALDHGHSSSNQQLENPITVILNSERADRNGSSSYVAVLAMQLSAL